MKQKQNTEEAATGTRSDFKFLKQVVSSKVSVSLANGNSNFSLKKEDQNEEPADIRGLDSFPALTLRLE